MRNYRITYSKNPSNNYDTPNIFHGYADATFANHDDHKLTSGYMFSAGEGAIM